MLDLCRRKFLCFYLLCIISTNLSAQDQKGLTIIDTTRFKTNLVKEKSFVVVRTESLEFRGKLAIKDTLSILLNDSLINTSDIIKLRLGHRGLHIAKSSAFGVLGVIAISIGGIYIYHAASAESSVNTGVGLILGGAAILVAIPCVKISIKSFKKTQWKVKGRYNFQPII